MVDLPRNPDVVIVGAGAAGVGAGLALTRLGVPFVILEAKERIGGRAYSDTTSLGHLWDHGCHWFHSADRNPLRAIADRLGHGYRLAPGEATIPRFVNGRWDTQGEPRLHVWDELHRVAAAGQDIPAEAVIDTRHPDVAVVRHWISLMTSCESRDVSALDYGRYEDTHVNLPVREGYGALIARLARGLPIRLDCPVLAIGRAPGGCTVETADGTLRPKAVILTASVNVLRSGAIRFTPALPDTLASALDDVPCGSYEKIAIRFEGNPFGGFDSEFCDILDPPGTHPLNIEVGHHGRPLAIAHVAGDFARDMAGEGQEAMIAYVKERLVAAFGGEIARDMSGATTTRWGADPFIRGGYACAKPGRATSRETMIEADLAPLYLAGEAFHPYWNASAHGAYTNGMEAAHKMAGRLGIKGPPADPLWLPDLGPATAAAQ